MYATLVCLGYCVFEPLIICKHTEKPEYWAVKMHLYSETKNERAIESFATIRNRNRGAFRFGWQFVKTKSSSGAYGDFIVDVLLS